MSKPVLVPTLAIEPNRSLAIPYMHLPKYYTLNSVDSPSKALELLSFGTPDLILLSTNVKIEDTFHILWKLKQLSRKRLIPVIFVIDWAQPQIILPGTTWGEKVGVLHSISSEAEVIATLERIEEDEFFV